ncbi:MAG: BamA/TamA family outer membrane protein [Candidatus Coatesbacteria bacterium]|nr:BamA/TamA family outer membrane protein [Candidatus Coatesbacteria bacterium]
MKPLLLTLVLALSLSVAAEEDYQPEEIVRVAFRGNEYLADGTLKANLGVRAGQYLSERRLERGRERLEELYRDNGFSDAVVEVYTERRFGLRGGLIVYAEVDEGSPSRVGEVTVEHHDKLDDALVRESVAYETGDVWTLAYTDTLEARLRSLYADYGYIYAAVEVQTEVQGRLVDMHFSVDEGRRVRLGGIEIVGHRPILERVVRREIVCEVGDWLSMGEVFTSQRNIYATGVFDNVNHRLVGREEGATEVVLRFELEPDETNWLAFLVGYEYSQAAGSGARFEITWGDDNLFGNLQHLEVGAAFLYDFANTQFERELYQAAYREPWLLSVRNLAGKLRLYYERERLESYKVDSFGANLGLEWLFAENYTLSPGARFERANLWEVSDDAPEDLADQRGFRNTTALNTQFITDLRDDAFLPRRGFYSNSFVEYAGGILGGDNDFYKLTQELTYYRPFGDSVRLALHAYGGLCLPHADSTSVPIYERFFLGGAYSLRGFPEKSVGPRDTADAAVGGEVSLLANAELRIDFSDSDFSLGLFVDGGMVWPDPDLVDLGDLAVGYGFGVRYLTAIGPVRLDLGFVGAPGRGYAAGERGVLDYGDNWELHLALGHIF